MLPNCTKKQNTNSKKWSHVSWLRYQMCSIIMKHSRMLKQIQKTLRQLVPLKSKQTKCNFQNHTVSASTFNNFFATAGEKTYNDVKQRNQTNGLDVQDRHERTHLRITRKSSLWSPQSVQAADVILALSSTGHYKINLQHIIDSLMVTIIITYITLIINRSIVTNVFPESRKAL